MPHDAPLLKLTPARAIWTVSWPMIAIGFLKTAYFLTDSYWLGRVGDDALIAVGGSAFAWWMLALLGEIAGTGSHALAARHTGAGQPERVAAIAGQGVLLALGIGVVAQVVHPLLPLYFDLLGYARDAPESALGAAYLSACTWGTVAVALHAALGGIFRGIGDTRTVLWITGATVAANAVLDPMLIWGIGPIPALGIAGAAWATIAANALGAVLAAIQLGRRGLPVRLTAPDWPAIRRIVEIGLPVSARGIAFSGIYVVLGRMITEFGTHQMAALGVGHRIESIPYLATIGFEVGCATLVGQHLGAGNVDGARTAARTALKLCLAAMVPATIALFVFAEPLFGVFASRPETVAAGALYLRIQTTVFLLMAFESVYEGAFTGTGNTVPTFWIGVIGTLARIPLAWALAWPLGLGVAGIWWAIALSTAVKGLAMGWFFERHGLGDTAR